MGRRAGAAGRLAPAVGHFVKVTRSYWPGLFACYDTADLPRTNNDLEQFFGAHRYHERRASGRKTACAGTVVRGSSASWRTSEKYCGCAASRRPNSCRRISGSGERCVTSWRPDSAGGRSGDGSGTTRRLT